MARFRLRQRLIVVGPPLLRMLFVGFLFLLYWITMRTRASRLMRPLLVFCMLPFVFASLPHQALTAPASSQRATATSGNCGPMDVAFVVDTTTSMDQAIDNVKTELTGILDNIATASGNDYRLSLVTFGDDITIQENFASNNSASVESKFQGLSTSGGGSDEPEASDEALNTVVNALPAGDRPQDQDFTPPFRASALKVIILVTDARPGGFDDTYTPGVDDVNAHTRALEAAAKGIRISAVFVPTGYFPENHSNVRAIMRDYATTTSGSFVETADDGTGAGSAINNTIGGCGSAGADLSVTKTDSPDPVEWGQELNYRITVTNNGPSNATNVRLTDTLPNTVRFTSAIIGSWDCTGPDETQPGGTITCVLNSLAIGSSSTLLVTVTPASAAPVLSVTFPEIV